MPVIGTALIGLLLAYANGANDNFKGVATLFGSGTARYRRALAWATITTALGSLTALVLARRLLEAFSGKGLVPPQVVHDPLFPASVAASAGVTVLLATRLGFPVSTTHALLGGLVGAGLVLSRFGLDGSRLFGAFVVPLVTSPILAILFAGALYPLLRSTRRRLGVSQETCVCVGQEVVCVIPGAPGAARAMQVAGGMTAMIDSEASCRVRYRGSLFGLNIRRALDSAHYLSAGAVSFARGLNDTPKIAALMLVGSAAAPAVGIVAVGAVMAVGGWTAARRVAETMSHRVTEMTPGQGLTANILTSLLVIGASHLGFPVSTTHVSCGSLFGIGAATRKAHWTTIRNVLLAWVVTLPIAGALGALFATVLRGLR